MPISYLVRKLVWSLARLSRLSTRAEWEWYPCSFTVCSVCKVKHWVWVTRTRRMHAVNMSH